MTTEEQLSQVNSDGHAPPCIYWNPENGKGARAYALYNRAGENPGLNYRGEPCPQWQDLPADVRAKWNFLAENI